MRYEPTLYRPPSEARSYILQATIGCSWNRCTFCEMYTQPQKRFNFKAIEDIDPGPVEAIRAAGGNDFQVVIYGVLPQVLPQVLSVIVFEWEINIRRSAILGLVGAGGLGLVFFRQMNTFNYHGVMTVIIAILGLILLGEAFSHWVRRKLI